MNIKLIVVHCSDSPQGRGDNAETIHRWHQEQGWDGIGYHAVILEDGVVQLGRPPYWFGAHAKIENRESLGVCLIGKGGDATDDQLKTLRTLINSWEKDFPGAEVIGHRDVDSSKTCPGFDAKEWYESGRNPASTTETKASIWAAILEILRRD